MAHCVVVLVEVLEAVCRVLESKEFMDIYPQGREAPVTLSRPKIENGELKLRIYSTSNQYIVGSHLWCGLLTTKMR